MARVTLRVETRDVSADIERLGLIFDQWSDAKRARFADQWAALEACGAEMAVINNEYGCVVARIGPDFRQHLERYGVAI